jgi:hypothetical protein
LFVIGKPAYLYSTNDIDWVPTINLGSLGQDTQLLSLPTGIIRLLLCIFFYSNNILFIIDDSLVDANASVQHECETQQEKTSSSPTIELGSASHCLDANLSVGDETASATTDEHEETTNANHMKIQIMKMKIQIKIFVGLVFFTVSYIAFVNKIESQMKFLYGGKILR